MFTLKKHLADAGLYFLLAANHLAHQPATPESVIASLAYLALASLHLSAMELDTRKPIQAEPGLSHSSTTLPQLMAYESQGAFETFSIIA